METSLLTSIIGIIIFTILMRTGYKYASGNWSVSECKKQNYLDWSKNYGPMIQKSIITISIMYGIGMTLQVFFILTEVN